MIEPPRNHAGSSSALEDAEREASEMLAGMWQLEYWGDIPEDRSSQSDEDGAEQTHNR